MENDQNIGGQTLLPGHFTQNKPISIAIDYLFFSLWVASLSFSKIKSTWLTSNITLVDYQKCSERVANNLCFSAFELEWPVQVSLIFCVILLLCFVYLKS